MCALADKPFIKSFINSILLDFFDAYPILGNPIPWLPEALSRRDYGPDYE